MFATSSHPIRAALSVAAVSATALLSTMVPWNASAQELANAKGPAIERIIEKQPSLFTRRECAIILSTAEEVFRVTGHLHEGYNSEFPISLAKFMAPSNHMLVHEMLTTRGAFDALVKAKTSEDVAKRAALRLALTCDGPKDILTSGPSIDMFNVIKGTLYRLPERINLDAAGLRSVSPQVVGSLPGPAAPKGPRLDAPDVRLGEQRLRLN